MLLTRTPDAETLAAHREFYGARKSAAPPEVRNAQALAALGEHRALRWRGHTYRVPPVPFTAGWQLYVTAQVLTGEYPARERDAALRVGRKVAGSLVERRRFRPNPFRNASADEVAALIEFFLHTPDDTPQYEQADQRARVVDMLDGFHEFAHVFPALMRDALPASWSHYQYGLRYLRRIRARDEIRMAQAGRLAQADLPAWRRYTDDLRRAAEVH
jgi:hypothetical protein